jgi:hypothetical protein
MAGYAGEPITVTKRVDRFVSEHPRAHERGKYDSDRK